MKALFRVLIFTLLAMPVLAQTEKSISDTTTTTQTTRGDIKYMGGLPYYVQKSKSPRRLGFLDEITAASSGAVTSVNGKAGPSVTLLTTDIAEGTNQYFTTSRARGALSATGAATYNSTTGVFSWLQPALTGDASIASGGSTITLATVNTNTGSFGSGTAVPVITFDGKGRATSVSTSNITPAGIGAEPTIPGGTASQFIAANKTVGTFSPSTVNLGSVTNALQVINAGGVVSEAAGLLSARPTAGTAGRFYMATDNGITYQDNGTTWVAQLGAYSGDVNIPLGSTTTTLATVNSNVGSFGSTSVVPVITVDAKGRTTAVSTATITPSAIGAADATAVVPYSTVSTYSGLSGVAAPASGFLKFVMVTTDGQYNETRSLYLIDSGAKIKKLALLPSEN